MNERWVVCIGESAFGGNLGKKGKLYKAFDWNPDDEYSVLEIDGYVKGCLTNRFEATSSINIPLDSLI